MGKTTEPVMQTKAVQVKVSSKAVEGERTILAVVSSTNFDRDYERVDVTSLRLPLKGGGTVYAKDLTGKEAIDIPMLLNHSFDVEDVIGSVRKAYLNEMNELVVEFGISGRAKAQDLMTLIDEKHLDNAFSITMSDYNFDNDTIYDAEIVEISMVFRGSNKDARVLAVKSLIKESSMAEAKEQTLAEKKAEIERLKKELEVAEADVVETPDEQPADETPEVTDEAEIEADEEADEPVDGEAEAIAEAEAEDEADDEQSDEAENNEAKETKQMSDKITAKQVKDTPAPEVVEVVAKKASKKEIRELFVKQFIAYKTKNVAELEKLNEKAMELDGVKSKEITYANASALYQSEVVATDIFEQYSNTGRVGSLVNKIDILGATQWKQIVQTRGSGFAPVGIQETKAEDKPVWTPITILPKEHALIVAWYDAIARETPIAVYQQIVRYIADEYAKLEDKIVISFDGITTGGGDVFARTGLVPLLLADGTRTVNVATFTGAAVQPALGMAYGLVESDKQLSMVCNRKTWGRLATTVDTAGVNTFTVVGQQVTAGALGTFNIVISEEVTDGNVVLGAFDDYQLVSRGGLETLFSREATVGTLNLFEDDASAVRACVDVAGKPVSLKSFVLLDFVPAVS
jgi:hypothetical protein